MANAVKHLYEFGPFQLDPGERLLRRGEERLDLPPRVFDTLLALAESDGRLLEKDALMDRIWPDAAVEENNLTQAIYLLRKVLQDGENGNRYIETVPKRGYRFVAAVRDVGCDSPVSAGPGPLPVVVTDSSANAHPFWRWAVLVLAVIVVGLVAFPIARRFRSRAIGGGNGIQSLAVLPLQNLSNDSGQDYFADGFTEELVTEIAQIRSLRVISRTSTMTYKGSKKPLPQIANELHANLILEGSVVRDGSRVR